MTKKKKQKKKEAQLLVRLDVNIRDQFMTACEELDTSASREVRQFIKRFLTRYENDELDT